MKNGEMKKSKKFLSRKNAGFISMLIFNIYMMFMIIHMFSLYVSRNNGDMLDNGIQNVSTRVADLSTILENSFMINKGIIYKHVDYIERENLNKLETVQYMEHWIDFYEEIMIIDVRTGETVSIELMKNGEVGRSAKQCAEFVEVAERANLDFSRRTMSNILITDVFEIEGKKGCYYMAYSPVSIEGKDFILAMTLTVSELEKSVKSANGFVDGNTVMIDGTGKVALGHLPMSEEGIEPDNFMEELEKRYGKDKHKELLKILEHTKNGIYEIENEENSKWLCIFSKINYTNDWTFMYVEHPDAVLNAKKNKHGVEIPMIISMFIWLCIDICGYYLYNRKLRKMLITIDEQNQNLQAASMAKNQFISNMSHEIRTPINAVLGMDEMILRETDDEQIREYAHDIQNAGKVLLGLINDILDYSKIESGKMEIIDSEYEIGSVINDLSNIIEMKAKHKGLELILNVNPNIPHVLYGDELRIKQIVLNILTNAIKYTEEGSVTFSIDFERKNEKEIILKISVADTGIGIKKEEMDKLCSAFERLDEKRNRTIEGTGLGMSIVTRLLEQMNSKLEVESEYGKGSVFSFEIVQPVIDDKPVGDISEIRKKNKVINSEEKKTILMASRAKLLVVDDTLVNLTVVKGLLKRTGIQIDTANCGQECLDLVARKKYDLILLDHRMPKMDGIETLKRLKKMGEEVCKIPVIVLTANVVSGAYEMYIKEGFTDFLSKPINSVRLEKMILKYLPPELLDSEDDIAGMIDEKFGIEACGTEDIYMQVLKEFADMYKKNSSDIAAFYEQKDIENYTIKVHALKSSARLVGASNLSQEAAAMEANGNEKNWDAIVEGTEKLLKHYGIVAEKICEKYGLNNDDDDKEVISDEKLREAFASIRELNEAFDFDSIDMIMNSVAKYKLPDEIQTVYDKLKVAVYEFNQEQIRELLEFTKDW